MNVYMKEKEAARYLSVSVRHFQMRIRPVISRMNFAEPSASRGMWRYLVSDLDKYAEKRRNFVDDSAMSAGLRRDETLAKRKAARAKRGKR